MYVSLSNYCTFDHNFFVVVINVKEIFIKKRKFTRTVSHLLQSWDKRKNTENSYIYFLTVNT